MLFFYNGFIWFIGFYAHHAIRFQSVVNIPTHPHHLCQSEICGRKEIPTERTELTEPLVEKSLPQMAQMFTDVGRHTKFVLFELFVFAPPHQYHAFFSNTNLSYLTNADLVMRRPETSATDNHIRNPLFISAHPNICVHPPSVGELLFALFA